MKRLILSACLLAAFVFTPQSKAAGFSGVWTEPVSIVKVVWVPLGIGAICAAMPSILPGCGIGIPASAWLKITFVRGVKVSEEFFQAHEN